LPRYILFLFLIVLFIPSISSSQEETAVPDSLRVDSLLEAAGTIPLTYAETPRDSFKTQNPTAALFKSMLVPGLGQIGNKRYIKAGFAIALESVFIGAIVHWAGKTNDARERFENEPDTSIMRASLFRTYSDYKNQRNFYSWMLGTTIFISMFDAYVDAHLLQFPRFREEKGFSFDLGPSGRDCFAVTFSWKF